MQLFLRFLLDVQTAPSQVEDGGRDSGPHNGQPRDDKTNALPQNGHSSLSCKVSHVYTEIVPGERSFFSLGLIMIWERNDANSYAGDTVM